jgi:hypothetical protein
MLRAWIQNSFIGAMVSPRTYKLFFWNLTNFIIGVLGWLLYDEPIFLFFWFIINALLIIKSVRFFWQFFLPLNFFSIYISFGLVIGYFAFLSGFINPYYHDFLNSDFTGEIVVQVAFISAVSYIAQKMNYRFDTTCFIHSKDGVYQVLSLILFLTIFFIATVVEYRSILIGVRVLSAFLIAKELKDSGIAKYIVIIVLMTLSVYFSFENKREIIMVIFSILIGLNVNRSINFSKLFLYGIMVFLFVILASIFRGYGDVDMSGVSSIFLGIASYLGDTNSLRSVSENFELLHLFPSMVIITQYWLYNGQNYLLGSSLITPFLIFIPREIWPDKPDAAVNEFTNFIDSSYWEIGGSFPVPIHTEFIMNFGFVGLFLSIVFLYLLHRYFSIIIFRCNSYSSLIFGILPLSFLLIRGSGLDIYTISVIPALIVFIFINAKYTK